MPSDKSDEEKINRSGNFLKRQVPEKREWYIFEKLTFHYFTTQQYFPMRRVVLLPLTNIT